jgi:hypothetical protein
MIFRALFIAIALAFGSLAQAATPSFPLQNYWIVADTNPTTQVWNGATGALVANTDATYQAWVGALKNDGTQGGAGFFTTISASANNGSGLIRLTVANTNGMTTGDVDVVNGTSTVADGTWTITVIDAACNTGTCRVDLQGSTFSGASATTGNIGSGTRIPTMAGLLSFIDSQNTQPASKPLVVSMTNAPRVLTNPLAGTILVQNGCGATCGSFKLVMPQSNLFGSIPLGYRLRVVSQTDDGAGHKPAFNIYANDGTTLIVSLLNNEAADIELTDNSTANGTFIFQPYAAVPVPTRLGGVGSSTAPTTGQMPVGQGSGSDPNSPAAWETMSGDCTNNASFVITCPLTVYTGTSGHKIPYLDGSNAWSGVQTFNDGDLALAGSGSGSSVLHAPATGGGAITLPAGNQTLASLTAADQTLSGGANVTANNIGTVSSGTTTLDCGTSPLQYMTNNGAFTLAAPANDGSCIIRVTNGASAGAITFSGWTVGSNTGDAYATTNTNKYDLFVRRINGASSYQWSALQ